MNVDYENEECQMCANFDDFWKRAVPFLHKKIKYAGGELDMGNWTEAGRFKRKIIPITEANTDGITCLTDAGGDIRVSRQDLKYTWDKWDDYRKRKVLRKQIRDDIRTSTFTICTIHYLFDNGICPCNAAI